MSQLYTIEIKMKRNYGGVITSVSHSLEVDQTIIDELVKENKELASDSLFVDSILDLAKAINVTTELDVRHPSSLPQV